MIKPSIIGLITLGFALVLAFPVPGSPQAAAGAPEARGPLPSDAVHEAVRQGDLDRVKGLLTRHPEWLNAGDARKKTPLLASVLARQQEVFEFLLGLGADANLRDGQGMGPLWAASLFGLDDFVRRLILKGADVNAQIPVTGLSPLHAAVRAGKAGCAELLLANGARLDLKDREGRTPLLLAAFLGRAELARILIAKGASLKDRDALGSTVLHLASLSGFTDCVKVLVASGAPLDPLNSLNGTPMSIAVREGYDEVARILKAAGAAEPPRTSAPRGDYLGLKPPGTSPELFAPGVVSTEKEELNSVFTPDGKEFYFTVRTVQGPWKIMVMKRNGEDWAKPETASFSGTHSDVDLFISPDGRTLFFCSDRPAPGKGVDRQDFDIWAVERRGAGWSEPRNLGAPVNSPDNEFYPSVTRDGTLYFQSWRAAAKAGANIYRAELENGSYSRADMLGEPINSDGFEGDALISPDEGFLVFSVDRPAGLGRGDLWVSFRRAEGSWTDPLSLGSPINTKVNENCPVLSPDGKYLFYTGAGDIYWVRTDVIEKLRTAPGKETRPLSLTRRDPAIPNEKG